MMQKLALALAASLLACTAVGKQRQASSVCPEFRTQRCLTVLQCQLDAARACEVCTCTPASRALDLAPPMDQRESVPVVPPESTPRR